MRTQLAKVMGREKLQFRKDMPDFVLDLLRQIVGRELRELVEHSVGREQTPDSARGSEEYIVACPGGASRVESVENAGCVLYLRPIKSAERASIEQQMEAREKGIEEVVKAFTTFTRNYILAPSLPTGYLQPVAVAPPRLNPAIQKPPLYFPSAEYQGGRVAVYGLVELLGEEGMHKALESTRLGKERCLVVKQGAESLRLQTSLLKLQTYLAEA